MDIKPHVVQVEAHPYFPQTELKAFLAETGMVTGENDSYYGSSSVRETYEKLVSLYKEMGFSEEQIDRLVVLDLKDQAWFDERGIRDQHGGGGSFAYEADIMSWLFGEH